MNRFYRGQATPDERFNAKYEVDPETDCWPWTSTRHEHGYGLFFVGRRYHRAHRWNYERTVGPVPEGLHLDHLCRNRACVNPEHLEPVTPRENAMRGEAPLIAIHKSGSCSRGHVMDSANAYVIPGTGHRRCRTCGRENAQKHAAARRTQEAS